MEVQIIYTNYLTHILLTSYGYLVCWQVYFSVAHVLEWDLNDFVTWEALSHWLPSSALCGGLDHSGAGHYSLPGVRYDALVKFLVRAVVGIV